jgi:tetratricopeptide (TPR) repeat protein
MTSVCLNMIVKNEAHVIRRCLDSVRPLITTWCILDTGSTDGTQDIIREHYRDLPGALHEAPWKGFGASRTEALQLGRGMADYLCFIDADCEMRFPEGFTPPTLTADAYHLRHRNGEYGFVRLDLAATRLDWSYVGVLHEVLSCPTPTQVELLEGPWILEHPEGARSRDPKTYEKDAAILEEALREDPTNARHQFYLAQSYRDAGQPKKALEAYRKRAAMGGWAEEVYISLLRAAQLLEGMEAPEPQVVHAYLMALEARPGRAETHGRLAAYLRGRKRYTMALNLAEQGMALPIPPDLLFVGTSYHTWRCLDEFAVAAYWVGRFKDCRDACDRLLSEGHLPEGEVARVAANRDWAIKWLNKGQV